MMLRLGWLLEVLAIVVCLHRIYGKKIELNIVTCITCMVIIAILEAIDSFQVNYLCTGVIYILLFFYCLWNFKESILNTIINEVFFLIIFSATQFLGVFIVNDIIIRNEILGIVINNMIILAFCVFVLPKCKIDKVVKYLHERSVLAGIILGFSVIVVGGLIIQSKYKQEIRVELYILVIPAILLLFIILSRWLVEINKVKQLEQEAEVTKKYQPEYAKLVSDVRMRQHEFKNHISAILSTHYSYHTYEQLVKAQKEYYGKVEEENKFNKLLSMGDEFVCGFLFGKFMDIEERGITVGFEIHTQVEGYALQVHYLIEMLGVLLDNAVEAIEKESDPAKKTIRFTVSEDEAYYHFIIANPYPYVPYSEMGEWFGQGVSTKGNRRGLGLAHLKQLCEEWQCHIMCSNKEMDEKNWIEMTLQIKKSLHK